MGFLDFFTNPSFAYSDNFDNPLAYVFGDVIGYNQYKNTLKSTTTQIKYNDYLKRGNQRALEDWNKNVGSKGLSIRYPEFSYPGQINQLATASNRARYDADTARANYYGNIPYRVAGLYGISSRASRWL